MKTILLKTLVSLALPFAIATSVDADERWIKVAGGKWDPSPKMLVDLKAQIKSYVCKQAKAQGRELRKWQDYTFQLLASEENGRRYILINALCKKFDRQRLSKEIIYVMDGGSCYFNVKYDPLKKTFFDLYINGKA